MGAVYLDGCESCKVQGLRSIAATTPVESWLVNSTTGVPLHGDFVQRTGNYISGYGNVIADSIFSLDAFNSLSINGSENTVVNSRFQNVAHLSCAMALFLGPPWFVSRDSAWCQKILVPGMFRL